MKNKNTSSGQFKAYLIMMGSFLICSIFSVAFVKLSQSINNDLLLKVSGTIFNFMSTGLLLSTAMFATKRTVQKIKFLAKFMDSLWISLLTFIFLTYITSKINVETILFSAGVGALIVFEVKMYIQKYNIQFGSLKTDRNDTVQVGKLSGKSMK